MIVTVTPEDFPDKGVLGGVEFQRDLEKKHGSSEKEKFLFSCLVIFAKIRQVKH